ncbi:hypothetical protein [Kineosporia sp. R_H_3]|uniref:hypothetical protein n=1 Tax=Kineosporia sp. R_H_3 TaxID=1961848 RepID=UPI000B4C1421|nr:hypothetical protein [Kineosporia sp. R_H_3]
MDAGDRGPQGPLPLDRALPGLQRLEPAALAHMLGRHAGGAEVTGARVRHLVWSPGHRFAAHVEGVVHGSGGQPGSGVHREAVVVASTDPEVPDGVRWLPDDPHLPVLTTSWARAAARLHYRPGRRIGLAVGDRVVTGYPNRLTFERGREGLEVLRTALGPAAAGPDRPLAHLLATAHHAVAGRRPGPDAAVDVALPAGEVLARLHRSEAPAPRSTTGGAAIAAAEAAVRVVTAALPAEGRRAGALVDDLRRCLPPDDDMVLSHGRFEHGRLVRASTAAAAEVVLDSGDDVAAAPRALDVATYPAALVDGRPGDAERAEEALDRLLDGYGIGPRHLDWHLATAILRRCDEPLRRLAPLWQEQTVRLLDTVAEVTRRCTAVTV